jgi:hypothetical protein
MHRQGYDVQLTQYDERGACDLLRQRDGALSNELHGVRVGADPMARSATCGVRGTERGLGLALVRSAYNAWSIDAGTEAHHRRRHWSLWRHDLWSIWSSADGAGPPASRETAGQSLDSRDRKPPQVAGAAEMDGAVQESDAGR